MKKTILVGALAAVLSRAFVACANEVYDLVVYGSSPAALTAAIEAQSHGKRAVIVCPETRIGGLTTGGLGQTDIGNKSAFGGLALQFYKDIADHYKNPANWTREQRSAYVPDGQCAGTLGADSMWTFEPSAALTVLTAWEKKHGLKIVRGEFLDRRPGGVLKEGARVTGFKTLSGKTFRGKMFVDATYEGDLFAAAGVSYVVGREPNARYGEVNSGVQRARSIHHQMNKGVDPYVVKGDPASGLLPLVEPDTDEPDGAGDKRVQAYCFRMCLTDDPANRIPFARPEGYRELDYELLLRNLEAIDPKVFVENAKQSWKYMPWINSRMPNRKTDTNNRTGFSTDFIGQNYAWPEGSYEDRAKIFKAHLDYQRGLMWTLANHPRVPAPIRNEVARWGTCRDEFADGSGDGWQSQLYVREGRRMVGDYVMTEAHCRHQVRAPRPIAMGAYTMDSHNVRRYVDKNGFARNEGNIEDFETLLLGPYSIDYGAIVPKKAECENLFAPVCLSASHMAFGSIRMEPVFFALGQVAGAAAALAIDGGCAVQDLDYAKLRAVLLAKGQVVETKETLFLEAEAFRDWGGWANDTQFMDQTGSPYLLAHGLGKPVADATTTFTAEGGAYRVYVRTKNWTAPWYKGADGAGGFTLKVNGEELPKVLGREGDGKWLWTDAGTVALKAGENTVALHDLDGFDGRCDVVVFAPGEKSREALDRGRAQALVRMNPSVQKANYDFVVVGGGIAGICSAVSAARLGLKTALVQDRPVLGGNNSSEVRVHLGAWQNVPPYPRLGDVVAEIGPKKGGNAQPKATYEDDRKLKVVQAQENLDLFLNERVNGVTTNGAGAIVSVTAQNTRTGAKRVFAAKWFADCTGDGTVGFLAGADWRMGREAKSAHNEPWAPENADMLTMGSSVQWYAGNAAGEAAFPLKPWMIRFTDANGTVGVHGDWFWETGLGRDQIKEAEYIRDYGLLVAYSNWAYAKNVAANKAKVAGKELKWVAYNAGRRETRRLMGDFILTENDLMNKNFQPDGTCATTWTIDLHLPKSKKDSKFDGEPFQTDSLNHYIWPYPVPYRCYYSRNVPNLFMAGRNISVTHVALGTTRLMRTHGMMGEVVGMAASLCKKHGCNPRAIYTDHLDELKALMEKGVGDGKAHPPQMYNIQESLDPSLMKRPRKNHQIR